MYGKDMKSHIKFYYRKERSTPIDPDVVVDQAEVQNNFTDEWFEKNVNSLITKPTFEVNIDKKANNTKEIEKIELEIDNLYQYELKFNTEQIDADNKIDFQFKFCRNIKNTIDYFFDKAHIHLHGRMFFTECSKNVIDSLKIHIQNERDEYNETEKT